MIYFGDVDVVWKLATCGFLPRLPELLGVPAGEIDIRYLVSLRARLSRPNKRLTNAARQVELERFCMEYAPITGASDPERQEELQRAGLDPGEALLFAEAEATGGIVVTGEKRALKAYAQASTAAQRTGIKVVCWEQLLLRVREMHGYEALRAGCCEGLACDGLLSLAFSSGLATREEHALEAIESYLRGVREHSGDILFSFES
jgi:hypothetical protein